MGDGFVQVAPDSTGKLVDSSEIKIPTSTGTNTVERQRIVIADPLGADGLAKVSAQGAYRYVENAG